MTSIASAGLGARMIMVTVAVALSPGCFPADPAASNGTTGPTGNGGGSAGGAPTSTTDAGLGMEAAGGAGPACSETPTGCLCVDGDSEPGALGACNTSSVVKNSGEQATCCDGAILCTCDTYVCRHDALVEYCLCGTAFAVDAALQGTAVAECPAPTGDQKCCLLKETNTCACSILDCDDGTVSVSKCSLAEVALCGTDQQAISGCK